MTVRRYGRSHGASTLGKPALHPANVDLKSKVYEYVLFGRLSYALQCQI